MSPDKFELLTISRMRAMQRCERYHCYSYEMGRRPIKTPIALFFGTLFHHALERWWMLIWDRQKGATLTDDQLLEHTIHTIRDMFDSENSNATVFDLIKAEELMRGYHFAWLNSAGDFKIIGVETEFNAKHVNPETNRSSKTFRLGGKIDVFVRSIETGILTIIEHKTTTLDVKPGAEYWQKLRMDGQVSQYIDGVHHILRQNGDLDEPVDCLYDVAKRPTIIPFTETPDESKKFTKGASCTLCRKAARKAAGKTAKELPNKDIPYNIECDLCTQPTLYGNQHAHDETPEEFRVRLRERIGADPLASFQRAMIVRLEEELEGYRYDTWDIGLNIRRKQLRMKHLGVRAWSRNPEACHSRGKCQYYGVCAGFEDINDDHIFMTTDQHVELTGSANKPSESDDPEPSELDEFDQIFGDVPTVPTQQDPDLSRF